MSLRKTVLLSLVVTALGAQAQAGTLIATFVGSNPSPSSVDRHIVSGPGAPQDANLAMERFDLLRTGGTDTQVFRGSGVANHIYAFCLEPRQFINQNQSITYDVNTVAYAPTNLGGMGATKGAQIEELFGRYQPDLAGPMSQLQAGALQISIWEIVRETASTLDVYSGNISFGGGESPAGMIALAQTYVQSLDGTGPKALGLFSITNGIYGNPSTDAGTQDLLVQANSVPEPTSIATAAFGVIGLAGMAYRRRKIAKQA
jgi:hypothetical protein